MNLSTIAIITATTEHTNTHVQMFFLVYASIRMHAMNIIILQLWRFVCIRDAGRRG